MRTAAFALAGFLGAAATTAAAAQGGPAPGTKPPSGGSPAQPPAPVSAADGHAYPAARPRIEAPRPPRGRICFGQAETREKITQWRLTDPVSATRLGQAEGEALRTRLCRWKQDDLVYEVFVLRRDGRVLRLYFNAKNGQAVSAADMVDHK